MLLSGEGLGDVPALPRAGCATSASRTTCTACPTTWASVRRRSSRIREIIQIAVDHRYTHIFAGYGFMAEDAEFIEAIENAGIGFIGPSSNVAAAPARRTRPRSSHAASATRSSPASTTSRRARCSPRQGRPRSRSSRSTAQLEFTWNADVSLSENAENLPQLGYGQTLELVTIAEIQKRPASVAEMWREHPKNRIRFKHIGGGGGKGQRVVSRPEDVRRR